MSRLLFILVFYIKGFTKPTDEIEFKEWGRWKNVSIPIFKTEEDTTFITIFHDGAGFFLFSNESRYSSIQKVRLTFPEGSRVVQINDQLIDQGEEV